jgi:tetratricopeptide (TPR) repeat protein
MKKVYLVLRAEISKDDIIDYYGPFMDLEGYCCYRIPFEKREAFEVAYQQHLKNTKNNQANIIILESDTNRICGYYPNATLFAQAQWNSRADRDYHVCCKTTDVIYIPPETRPTLPFNISVPESFFFPPHHAYTKIDALVANIIDGKAYENLVRYPPNASLYHKTAENDYENIFDEFEKTYNGRLLSLLLLASQQSMAVEKSTFATYCAAYALLYLAMPDSSLEVQKPLLKEYPDDVNYLLLKGVCQIRLNQLKESIETFNKAHMLEDADDVRYYLGLAYGLNGYHSVAYGMFSSLKEQYWKERVQGFLENIKRMLPHVTGAIDDVHLPTAYPLPWLFQQRTNTYQDHKEKEKYLCLIRDKGVLATPEEYVRQEFVYHLINDLGYPKEAILVEESLAHIDRDLRERVDILVTSSEIRGRRNLLMVECKAPHVPLDGIVGEQALRYNRILGAKYIILTNLDETQVYYYNGKNKKYIAAMVIPNYEQLLSDAEVKKAPLQNTSWVRPDYSELTNPPIQQDHLSDILGEGIDEHLHPAIYNLAFMLLDEKHKLQCPFVVSPFTILKDNGLTTKSVGNPSGWGYHGTYRWFSVQDNNKRIYHIYLGVFWSYLIVAIDKNGTPISVLQIDLNKRLRPNGLRHELTHSGVRSRRKVENLMPYIEKRAPYLLGKSERIYLGSLDTSQNLLLSDTKTAEVIANTISYALLRFELREMGV